MLLMGSCNTDLAELDTTTTLGERRLSQMDSERQQLLCQLCLRQLKSEEENCLAWPLKFLN